MAQYKIARMPGDGVGRDVMEAARVVLNAMKLDAEYNLTAGDGRGRRRSIVIKGRENG